MLADDEVDAECLDLRCDCLLAAERIAEIDQRLCTFVRVADPPLLTVPDIGEFSGAILLGPDRVEVVASGTAFRLQELGFGLGVVPIPHAPVADVGGAHIAVLLLEACVRRIVFPSGTAGFAHWWCVEWMLHADALSERREIAESHQCVDVLLIGVVIEQDLAVVRQVTIPMAVDTLPL